MNHAIDWVTGALLSVAMLAIGGLAIMGVVVAWDSVHYERQAFVASTACEVKRMEPRRKFLSSDVVCIPAYRGTKNDTLTVNGLKP